MREYKQVEDWIKQTVDHFGKLDGAANLAGTVGPRPYTYSIDEEDPEIWDFIMGVNCTVSYTLRTTTETQIVQRLTRPRE